MRRSDLQKSKQRHLGVLWRDWMLVALAAMCANAGANSLSEAQAQLLADVAAEKTRFGNVAMKIWDYAEVGYQEHQSSLLLQETLKESGFEVQAGLAGMPTAFVASYGEGSPVIGILAEFDALPGLTQAALPHREIIEHQRAGHACGHHLFGAGSAAAAIAVSGWLSKRDQPGTVRVYGTPAEEGGSGKVYLVREGYFDDVDTVLHWHASDRNAANAGTTLANKSARIRFYGQSSHAAAAPERGRSALDGVEAMTYMVNLLREHVPDSTRIHYVITHGGLAPNVVPDFAEVYYYVRHPQASELAKIWTRVMNAAEAAALGTSTEVRVETMHGNHSILPNETLAKVMHRNLSLVGGYTMTDDERFFAEALEKSFGRDESLLGLESKILPFGFDQGKGSTDVGDVSWMVPTAGLNTATWVPGTSAHSWQAIAAGGMSIGIKGMMVAAKTLALTMQTLLMNPDLVKEAGDEMSQRRGRDFVYRPLLGDRAPPLDYRNID